MSDLVVSTQGLTRRFKEKTAVSNLDLEIRQGQIYGFLGPNGCGKTTTMRMLTGLLTPSPKFLQKAVFRNFHMTAFSTKGSPFSIRA